MRVEWTYFELSKCRYFFWYFWLTIQNTAKRQVRNLFSLLAVFTSFCPGALLRLRQLRLFSAAAAPPPPTPPPSWGRESTKIEKIVGVGEVALCESVLGCRLIISR